MCELVLGVGCKADGDLGGWGYAGLTGCHHEKLQLSRTNRRGTASWFAIAALLHLRDVYANGKRSPQVREGAVDGVRAYAPQMWGGRWGLFASSLVFSQGGETAPSRDWTFELLPFSSL